MRVKERIEDVTKEVHGLDTPELDRGHLRFAPSGGDGRAAGGA